MERGIALLMLIFHVVELGRLGNNLSSSLNVDVVVSTLPLKLSLKQKRILL